MILICANLGQENNSILREQISNIISLVQGWAHFLHEGHKFFPGHLVSNYLKCDKS